jgi:hypothetical protein
VILSTCLRGMTKNSSFMHFRAIFMSYSPLFWGFVEIYKEYDSLYILERNDKRTCHFYMYGYFRELLPTVLEFCGDLQGPWHLVHVWEAWQKTHCFCMLGPFLWVLPRLLGFWGDLQGPWHSVHFFRGVTKNSSFLHFRAIFIRYCLQFGVLEWFQRSMTHSTCLRGMTKNSSFLRFRAVFMSYCPQFWGSAVIYKVQDTR